MTDEKLDQRIDRLKKATDDVRPRAGVQARVLAAARGRRAGEGLLFQLPRAARFIVPAAALAAVVAIGVALTQTSDVDDAMLSVDDTSEVSW